MTTYNVHPASDTEYWANHNVPMTMLYSDPKTYREHSISPTFVAREWDRTRWHYIHPETNEILRSTYTYF